MRSQRIWIMRGLPGSGKSFFVKAYLPRAEVFSADNLQTIDGVFKYDPEIVNYAHNQCLKSYITALMVEKEQTDFVVDNTNIKVMDLSPYVCIAQALGFNYRIIYIPCGLQTSIGRNIHKVPEEAICIMHSDLLTERLPFGWRQRVMFNVDQSGGGSLAKNLDYFWTGEKSS